MGIGKEVNNHIVRGRLERQRAFALPTVLITSIVMLTVLLAALTAASSISAGLKSQYFNQLSRTASQSGMTMAKACMEGNSGAITWTEDMPLKPNTDCTGAETVSCPNTATNAACYVLKSGNYRSTFKVKVTTDAVGTVTGFRVQGIVREVRKTSGEVVSEGVSEVKIKSSNAVLRAKLSAGDFYTCITGSDGKAYCWGYNGYGNLGDGTTTTRYTPVAVSQGAIPAGVTVTSIAASKTHTCITGSDGKAYCWGNNNRGQLGDGTTTQRYDPVAVSQGAMPAGVTVTSITALGNNTCITGSDGKAYCWGYNGYGNLGDGTTLQRNTPVAVSQGAMPAGVTVTSITAAYYHTCATGSDGKAYCWGYNGNGNLGDGTTTQRYDPVAASQGAMPAGVTVTSIAALGHNTCITGSDGKAYCWGANNDAQLGDGTTTTRYTPVAVSQGAIPAGATLTSIAVGGNRTCAISSNGKAYCWGANNAGQLGDGTNTTRYTPVAVSQGTIPAGVTLTSIAASDTSDHTCITGSDGKAYCWGNNGNGQLGDGTTTTRITPVTVSQGAMPAGPSQEGGSDEGLVAY